MHVPHRHVAASGDPQHTSKSGGTAPMRTRLNLPFTRLDVLKHVWDTQLTHGRLFVPTSSHCEPGTEVELYVTLPEASHPLILDGKVVESDEDQSKRAGLEISVPLGGRERGAIEAYLAGCFEEAHLILQAHRRAVRQSRSTPVATGSHALTVKPKPTPPESAPSDSLFNRGLTRHLTRKDDQAQVLAAEATKEEVRKAVNNRPSEGAGILKPGPKSRPRTRALPPKRAPKPEELSDAYMALIEAADELEHISKSAVTKKESPSDSSALPSSNSRRYGDILARREAARQAREARDSGPNRPRRTGRNARQSGSYVASDSGVERKRPAGPSTRAGRTIPPRTRIVKKNTGEIKQAGIVETRRVKVPSAAPVHNSVGLGSSLTGLDMSSPTNKRRGAAPPPSTRRVVRKDLDLDTLETRIFRRDKKK